MKRLKIVILSIVFCELLSLLAIFAGFDSFAVFACDDVDDVVVTNAFVDAVNIESLSRDLFGNVGVKSSEYLYNYDDSPDYVYVKYTNYGYAVYARETLELLEYASQGNLPYSDTGTKKYYGGPANYFLKESELFTNVLSGESISISAADAKRYSDETRNMFSNNCENERQDTYDNQQDITFESQNQSAIMSAPPYIYPITPGVAPITYIPNYQYFIINPIHGPNSGADCGPIAAQILLSYHNYYSDRRIIDNGFLFNGEDNPNECTNPMLMTSGTLGSRDIYFEHIRDNTTYVFGGTTDLTVKNGIKKVLDDRGLSGEYNLTNNNLLFPIGAAGRANIRAEIDAGRPLIIGTYTDELKHFLVGYGYQNMVREDGVDYEGYIVHFGWGSTGNNAWINSRWCNSYIRLTMQHIHNHNIDTGRTINHTHRELNCSECGYRTVDNLYNTNSAGTEIKGLRYSISGSITIPSQINGITVTQIGEYAFFNSVLLTNITIPNTLTSIGEYAFAHCNGLTSITFAPNSQLTSIGKGAFFGCSFLMDITIPNSVTSIEIDAFFSCVRLEEIIIPDSVTNIGSSAFDTCSNLTNVTISSGVTSIGDYAFYGCVKLTEINYYATSMADLSINNGVFSNAGQNGSGITLNIGANVTKIPSYLFYGVSKITQVNFAEESSCQTIGPYAFCSCSGLTNITIPYSVTNISTGAFYSCSGLTSLLVPNSVDTIGSNAFYCCNNLTRISIPDSVIIVGSGAFGGCNNITNIKLPFVGNTLNGTSNTYFGYIFGATNYFDQNTYIPSTLKRVEITGGNSIKANAFYGCSGLTSLLVPNSISNIGSNAFYGCSSLTSILIPDSVSNIGSNAFYGCSGLTTIYFEGESLDEWNTINNSTLPSITNVYCYSEDPPYVEYYWRYVNDIPTIWIVKTVTFDKQDGTGGSDFVVATVGAPMPISTAPTRTGLVFGGYYSQPFGGGTKYYNADMTSANNYDGITTLYAKWTATLMLISIFPTGDYIYISITATFGAPMPSAQLPPYTQGYIFLGYFTQPYGGGIQYYNSNLVCMMTYYTTPGNLTLFGYWIRKT